MDLRREYVFHVGQRLELNQSVVNYAGSVNHAVYGAESLTRFFRRLPNPFDVGDISSNYQHLRTFCLERPNLFDALADPIVRTVAPQPPIPLATIGKRGSREQHQLRARLVGQMVRHYQAKAAQTAGNEVHALVANPGRDATAGPGETTLERLDQPLAAAMRDHAIFRGSHQLIFERIESALETVSALAAFPEQLARIKRQAGFGQHQIDAGTGNAREFSWYHLDGPQQGRLLGIRQRLSVCLLHPARNRRNVKRPRNIFVAKRLGQEEKAVEAALHDPVKETRAGTKALVLCHQPQVRNSVRHFSARDQILHQCVIAFAAAFR